MTFGPQTQNQWRTRITCPDVRNTINTQLMNNFAANTKAAIPLWHIDKRLFRALRITFDLRLLPLTQLLFTNRAAWADLCFARFNFLCFSLWQKDCLLEERCNISEKLHFLKGAVESVELCLLSIWKEDRLLSPSLGFFSCSLIQKPFLFSPLHFFSLRSHSCSPFASQMLCLYHYFLSLWRCLDNFAFFHSVLRLFSH